MALKTTFGQSQRWSLSKCTLGVENEGKDNLNFANKVFNRQRRLNFREFHYIFFLTICKSLVTCHISVNLALSEKSENGKHQKMVRSIREKMFV